MMPKALTRIQYGTDEGKVVFFEPGEEVDLPQDELDKLVEAGAVESGDTKYEETPAKVNEGEPRTFGTP